MRARESLRGIFRLVGGRFQKLLIECADEVLGRFKKSPTVCPMVCTHNKRALAEINSFLHYVKR